MRILLITLVFLFSLSNVSCGKKKKSPVKFRNFDINLSKNQEPPLIFELISENESHFFVENQARKWEGVKPQAETMIKVYDWKLFPHNNIEFEYPRTFTFEADISLLNDIWTLSGNDFTIMIINPSVEISIDNYVDELKNRFDEVNCSTRPITNSIHMETLDGIKLSVLIAGTYIELDVYEIFDSSGEKSFIIFQDVLSEQQKNSKESVLAMKKIMETFRIN